MRRQKKRLLLLALAAVGAIICFETVYIFRPFLVPSLLGVIVGPDVEEDAAYEIETEQAPNRKKDEGEKKEEELLISYRFYHYDVSKKYKVIPFAVLGSRWTNDNSSTLCLATHSSVERLYTIAEALVSWTRPASIALFVPGPDAQIIKMFLKRLKRCNPEAFSRAAFHLVYPLNRPPLEPFSNQTTDDLCQDTPEKFLKYLTSLRSAETMKWREELPYPQNLLRNMANDRCHSQWVVTTDVDMITPPSLASRMEKFLSDKENCTKCAYVLPTYEVKEPNNSVAAWKKAKKTPDTKVELMMLRKAGSARPFHITVFKKNQDASKLSVWEKLPMKKSNDIVVAYEVMKFPFWYEPIYVAQHVTPQFDERFIGFGMTRNTQAYEMFLAGYKFEVLDNAFLIHWGFQEIKDRPKWRQKQSSRNYFLFKKWLLEKAVAYDADPNDLISKMAGDQSKRKIKVSPLNQKNKTADSKKKSKGNEKSGKPAMTSNTKQGIN